MGENDEATSRPIEFRSRDRYRTASVIDGIRNEIEITFQALSFLEDFPEHTHTHTLVEFSRGRLFRRIPLQAIQSSLFCFELYVFLAARLL